MRKNFQKISLILSLLFFLFCCFVFIFLYKKINDNNQKTEQNTILWAKEERLREDIRSLNRTLEEVEDSRLKLETHFAKSSDVVPFLNTIEKLAPEVGASAQIDSINTETGNTTLLVNVKVAGSFSSIYKFLTLLENSPYELEFLSMNIEKTAGDAISKKDSKWEAVFKIQLLSFVP